MVLDPLLLVKWRGNVWLWATDWYVKITNNQTILDILGDSGGRPHLLNPLDIVTASHNFVGVHHCGFCWFLIIHQNYKYSSWTRYLSHWFPIRKSSNTDAGSERVWEGCGPNWNVWKECVKGMGWAGPTWMKMWSSLVHAIWVKLTPRLGLETPNYFSEINMGWYNNESKGGKFLLSHPRQVIGNQPFDLSLDLVTIFSLTCYCSYSSMLEKFIHSIYWFVLIYYRDKIVY